MNRANSVAVPYRKFLLMHNLGRNLRRAYRPEQLSVPRYEGGISQYVESRWSYETSTWRGSAKSSPAGGSHRKFIKLYCSSQKKNRYFSVKAHRRRGPRNFSHWCAMIPQAVCCYLQVDQLSAFLRANTHYGFPVVLSATDESLIGFVKRKDLTVALCKFFLVSCRIERAPRNSFCYPSKLICRLRSGRH